LIAVIGQVGSGKSSLIHALLGELLQINGLTRRNGRIAFIPQTTWLVNATLRDNISFGYEFNEEKYE
jgi:ABC-type transport system involved in cytochrome bd biosynthesis fused ATPase/permease subunit